jgi:hypothetical protein
MTQDWKRSEKRKTPNEDATFQYVSRNQGEKRYFLKAVAKMFL